MNSETQSNPSKGKINRREFLKLTWAFLGTLAAVEIGGISFAYMQPREVEGQFGSTITAGMVDDFPAGSVTPIPAGRCYLVRLEDSGFLAVYKRCTHLGCSVPWDQEAGAFVCPCHSSHFDRQGQVINPPAPRPLDIFTVRIEDGLVKIDTSRPVSRQKFEASQVVYA